MIRAMKSFTLTATGQACAQVGFAQARQRSASRAASSGSYPRLTSPKSTLRLPGARSGIRCRGIFIRSLLGMLLATGVPRPLRPQPRIRAPLLIAIHGVALHEDLKVDRMR